MIEIKSTMKGASTYSDGRRRWNVYQLADVPFAAMITGDDDFLDVTR